MPLPILIPLAIKGGIVAAKFIASKHAAATVAKATVVTIKANGLAATVTAAAGGLTVVGGVVWTVERFGMAKRALGHFDSGDYLEAANELTRIARSFFQVEGHEFAINAQSWIADGASISSPNFKRLISDLRQIVDETAHTMREQRT